MNRPESALTNSSKMVLMVQLTVILVAVIPNPPERLTDNIAVRAELDLQSER